MKQHLLTSMILAVMMVADAPAASSAATSFPVKSKQELAREIRNDKRLDRVLDKVHDLFRSSGNNLQAGSHYPETWIRDLATFVEMALQVNPPEPIKQRLLLFLDFQGDDGNIVDGYVDLKHNHRYEYIFSKTAPQYKAHKNTVETDQESSFVLAVARYINANTGGNEILSEVKNGKTVLERCEMALNYVRSERFSDKYGLVKGATTIDWGDVQPEHSWGVYITEDTHWCIDVYDNALYLMAIREFVDWIRDDKQKCELWNKRAESIRRNVRKHLRDEKRQKFIPHLYLDGSPFESFEDFNENDVYYFGGTIKAIRADILNDYEIRLAFEKMVEIKDKSGARTISIVNYPPYPEGSFKNPSLRPYTYQNAGDWTWWGGRGIEAMVETGNLDLAYQEIGPYLDRVIDNNGFFEWYSVRTHKPHGARTFLGSAGALGKAIVVMKEEANRILERNDGW